MPTDNLKENKESSGVDLEYFFRILSNFLGCKLNSQVLQASNTQDKLIITSSS